MTLRDIHVACSRIDVRRHNNYAMQAALFGHKLNTKTIAPIKDRGGDFSKDDDKRAMAAMERAMNRMKSQRHARPKR